ncbi:T9SS type A sorting domain-containing protein [Rhodocaloribacter litoris]|nr:T9SS type A sorting domain-containing protein [Rhodocaloribacter litoris]
MPALLLALTILPARAQQVVTVTDADIVGNVLWTSDKTYLLDGYVYVEDGETLTIEAGTVIKGKADPTTGDQASALIVARGGKLFAEGTAEAPIIFTAEDDDVTVPDDLTPEDKGLWGGVLILGRATINVGGGENAIEGLPPEDPRNFYGGSDDEDDSGVLRYVSIRHGGDIFGTDNEINGLTMGAVGRGTTIEYVEVFANQDDGFEWFGGTVDTRYLVAAFCGDDGFDYDEGFRGRGQFWFLIQGEEDGGSGGEHDGGTDPETGQPYAIPVIYNATYIGSGASSLNTSNDRAVKLRDNAGGKYYNSIFTDFAGTGINIEDLASGEDSRARLEAGDLEFRNNLWFGFGDINGSALPGTGGVFEQDFVQAALSAADNFVEDPQLRGISRSRDGGLDPRPAPGSPAWTRGTFPVPNDGFFVQTDYIGAFGEENWLEGWTHVSEAGFTSTAIEAVPGVEVPRRVTLEQNYPNPFNPQTTIEFRLDRPQAVRLAVYDVLGREVAVLAEGLQPAGVFRATFDATGLSSGLYLYRLQTEAGVLSRTMMLVK